MAILRGIIIDIISNIVGKKVAGMVKLKRKRYAINIVAIESKMSRTIKKIILLALLGFKIEFTNISL